MAKKKGSDKAEKSTVNKETILLLPILFLTTLFLFAVRARVVATNLDGFFWFVDGAYTGDLYAYFRMQIFVLVTAVFAVYMIYCMLTGGLKLYKHKVYIPMAIYTLFVLISFMCSEYKEVAMWGAPERYEGTVALIFYMVLLFYSMNAIRSEKGVKLVVRCFSIACFVLGIWGICQSFGIRLNSIPAWLYIPSKYLDGANMNQQMVTTAVNWFFSNQNYASFFMIFPICLFAMTCIAAEDTYKKVIYAALTGLMLFCLWQAASLGGMVGLAVAVVAAILIAGVKNIKKWSKSLGLLFLAAVVSIGTSLPVIMREVQSGVALNHLLGIEEAYAMELEKLNEAPLRFAEIDYIITEGNDIIFSFAGDEIKIDTENGEIIGITDASGAALKPEEGLLHARTYLHEESGYQIIEIKTERRTWNFASVENEVYFLSQTGQGIKLDKVESIGFENNQDFATYRGYIWSRTLPLLKETMLLGKGADTYAIYFPQDDYAGRYNIGYYVDGQNTIIDKPHNMYLGAAVNTGVISMIALIAIYLIYLIESIKIYRKHEFVGFKDYIGMGICIAVAGFMISGLVNDSTVQMMPVVYALLGIGFAINKMVTIEKNN